MLNCLFASEMKRKRDQNRKKKSARLREWKKTEEETIETLNVSKERKWWQQNEQHRWISEKYVQIRNTFTGAHKHPNENPEYWNETKKKKQNKTKHINKTSKKKITRTLNKTTVKSISKTLYCHCKQQTGYLNVSTFNVHKYTQNPWISMNDRARI